jgi:hypothetical protein
MATAHLGDDLSASSGGNAGFTPGEGRGRWSATKWFVQNDGFEAEVYFNYNLADGFAEFTEKDADYRADLVEGLAMALRDGSRPPRSPETDPNFSMEGPHVTNEILLPNTAHCASSWTPSGGLLVTEMSDENAAAFLIDPARPEARREIVRVEKMLDHCLPLGSGSPVTRWIATEELKSSRNSFGPDDRCRFWIIDGASGDKRELAGDWIATAKLEYPWGTSPDGQIVVLYGWDRSKGNGKGDRKFILYFVRVGDGRTVQKIELQEYASVAAWAGDGSAVRALLEIGPKYSRTSKPQFKWLGLLKGELTPPAADEVLPTSEVSTVSPDGRYRFQLIAHEALEITDLSTYQTTRRRFHEDDRRLAGEDSVKWAGPGFLSFYTLEGQSLINATTLKMSFPGSPDASDDPLNGPARPDFKFSPDFKWAVRSTKQGIMLGTVAN